MRLSAGTAGFRPRPHFLWAGGGFPLPAFFATIRDASVPSGEVAVYLVKIVLWAANGLFKAFFACCGRFHRCGCASSGCGRGWPACVMRRVPAPFGRARPCADAHVYKRSGDTPVLECRRRVGPSARCPSQSVCSQSAVSRRLLLRQKEEKALQLVFCSAAASTSSGRFAKKSKPVSRSILSTETT